MPLLSSTVAFLGANKWLTALALATLLVYLLTDTIVRVDASHHPLIKTLIVEKVVRHTDVRIVEHTVFKPNGETETTKTTEDHSLVDNWSKDSNETTSQVQNHPWLVGAFYEPLSSRPYALAGYNLGPVSLLVAHPISVEIRPMIGAALRF